MNFLLGICPMHQLGLFLWHWFFLGFFLKSALHAGQNTAIWSSSFRSLATLSTLFVAWLLFLIFVTTLEDEVLHVIGDTDEGKGPLLDCLGLLFKADLVKEVTSVVEDEVAVREVGQDVVVRNVRDEILVVNIRFGQDVSVTSVSHRAHHDLMSALLLLNDFIIASFFLEQLRVSRLVPLDIEHAIGTVTINWAVDLLVAVKHDVFGGPRCVVSARTIEQEEHLAVPVKTSARDRILIERGVNKLLFVLLSQFEDTFLV